MTYGNLPPTGYPASSKWLHWLVALCVLVTVPVGLSLQFLAPGPRMDALFNFHKSLGILILMLMILRIINRFVVGAPAPELGIARWQRAASSAVHGLLYVLVTGQAIGGYVANSAYGAPTPFFGLFNIPPIVAQNMPLSERVFAVHRVLGLVIAGLVAIHIAAALMHYIVHRDGVLQRMLPRALGGR